MWDRASGGCTAQSTHEAAPRRVKGAGLYGGGADRVTFIRRLRALRPKRRGALAGWRGSIGSPPSQNLFTSPACGAT
jgi:hypothetical protein